MGAVSLFRNLEPIGLLLVNVWALPVLVEATLLRLENRSFVVPLTLGIDLACRAAHVASLAGPDGALIWRGRSLFTRPADLERLWHDIDCLSMSTRLGPTMAA